MSLFGGLNGMRRVWFKDTGMTSGITSGMASRMASRKPKISLLINDNNCVINIKNQRILHCNFLISGVRCDNCPFGADPSPAQMFLDDCIDKKNLEKLKEVYA